MSDTEIKTYTEKDTAAVITNRHTGTWKIGTYNIAAPALERIPRLFSHLWKLIVLGITPRSTFSWY